MGFQAMIVVTDWLAFDITKSEFQLGAVLLAGGIGQTLAAPIGGILADRFDHRRQIVAMQAAILGNAVILAVLTATDRIELWHLFASAGLFGITMSLHMPANMSFVFNQAGRDQIANALALNSGMVSVVRLAGPAIGGVLIGQTGPASVYMLCVGAYVSSILILTMWSWPKEEHQPISKDTSAIKEYVSGLSYAMGNPTLRWLIIALVGLSLIGLPFRDLLPAYADVLGLGPEGFGLLLSMAGLGSLIGSLVIAAKAKVSTMPTLLTVLGIAWAGSLVLLAIAPTMWAAIPILVLIGAVSTGYNTMNNILVQMTVDGAYRGRVLSIIMFTFGLHLVGAVAIGAMAEFTGIRWAFVATGLTQFAFIGYVGLVAKKKGMAAGTKAPPSNC